ncbi:unnamed protein product [Ilex paraguariensis]|uniref:Uncharacterized protein n=1 Tax=Ilex paraguariensis TaxID=185542 RepID=A0ABC8U064_9AQUA
MSVEEAGKRKSKAIAQLDLHKGAPSPENNSQQKQGPPKESWSQPVMNNTSNKDKGKDIITLLGDVGGAMEVPQPGKSLPQVGNMDANSSSAIKSVNNQCPNGPEDETQGTQQYQVCCKLKKIKDSFKAKSRELGDISERAKEAKEAVENCQRRLATDPLNNNLRLEEKQPLATYSTAARNEDSFLKQKSFLFLARSPCSFLLSVRDS